MSKDKTDTASVAGVEHERKFRLLAPPSPRLLGAGSKITQGYLNVAAASGKGLKVSLIQRRGQKSKFFWEVRHKGQEFSVELAPWVFEELSHPQARSLRIRRAEHAGSKGKKAITCTATVKTSGRLSRQEWDYEIPLWLFQALYPFTESYRIEKTRYTVWENGDKTISPHPPAKSTRKKSKDWHKIQVDYFTRFKGHVIAEIEYSSAVIAKSHTGPLALGPWIEVTYEWRHRHRQMMHAQSSPQLVGPTGHKFWAKTTAGK